jgi:hypothetical protein
MKGSLDILNALNVLRCCIIDINEKLVVCVNALNKDKGQSTKNKSMKVASKEVSDDDAKDIIAKKKVVVSPNKKTRKKKMDMGSDSDSDADFRPPSNKGVKSKKLLLKNADEQPKTSDDSMESKATSKVKSMLVVEKAVGSGNEMNTTSDEETKVTSPEKHKPLIKDKDNAKGKQVDSDDEIKNESDSQPKKKDKRKRRDKARVSGNENKKAATDKNDRKSSGGEGGSSYRVAKVVGSDNEVESDNEDTFQKLKKIKINGELSQKESTPLGLPIHVSTLTNGSAFPVDSDSEISDDDILDVS